MARHHLRFGVFLAVASLAPALCAQQSSSPNGAKPADSAKADSQTPTAAKPCTLDDNPFPEEQSKAAQKAASAEEEADRKAASSGSVAGGASSTSSSSSRDKLQGIDLLGESDSRVANGAGGTIVDPKLSAQDVRVGQQYYALGNYQGAYERFKEAAIVNPGNAEAVFYLAEAARKAAHLDESAENYRLYLAAEPDGGKAKAARKALAQLEGK